MSDPIPDAEREIAQLKSDGRKIFEAGHTLLLACGDKDNRIAALESLLSECMRVMGLYINVPEFDDLRVRWESLKQKP